MTNFLITVGKPDRCGKTADEGGKWQENTD